MAKSVNKVKSKKEIAPEDELTWKDLEVGAITDAPGSASRYKTGDWRSRRPTYDHSKCNQCTLCQVYCPEGCIEHTKEGLFVADLYYCKGCGICAKECPKKVITMVEEKE